MRPQTVDALGRKIALSGLALFLVLQVLAMVLYRGGNRFDPSEVGFSFLHNYWCDLLRKKNFHGSINQMSFIAYAANAAFGVGMAGAWLALAHLQSWWGKRVFLAMGVPAMLAVALLPFVHDSVVKLSGLLVSLPFLWLLAWLAKVRRWLWLVGGLLVLLACGVNYGLWITKSDPLLLIAMQRVAFIAVVFWFGGLVYAARHW